VSRWKGDFAAGCFLAVPFLQIFDMGHALISAWPLLLLQNLPENWGLLSGATAGLPSSVFGWKALLDKPAVAPHC